MTKIIDKTPQLSPRARLGVGAAILLALGAAGGAGAMSLTRPAVEMAPTTPTAIARLATSDGIVTVKGRVAEVFGNHFVVQDSTGRTMVDGGRRAQADVARGQAMMVQGRFKDGQLHASYLVGPDGRIDDVGPGGRPPHGPGGPGAHGPDGPPPPGGPRTDGAGGPPPPPPGGPAGAPPPPPPVGAAGGAIGCPPTPITGTGPVDGATMRPPVTNIRPR